MGWAQIQSDGTSRAVAYASCSLTSTEDNYVHIEKESLTLVNALAPTLLVSHFTFLQITNH